MRIVVVGQGGREHALGWRFAREGHEVIAIPGNPGLAQLGTCVDVPMSDVHALTRACVEARPDLVVVGPEAPLAAGLATHLRALGLATFGPSAEAARIESSKAFAKDVMARAQVPTAAFEVVQDEQEAARAIGRFGGRCAVKADGLAAGKGVVVCGAVDEAMEAARTWLAKGPVVVEERLEGPEISIIAVTDGRAAVLLPTARDHKRLKDHDEGPNTGGMGAVCPVTVEPGLLASVQDEVVRPVLHALETLGAPFSGALYVGLMLTPNGPRVLEFNARFGDPETQAIVTALGDDVKFADLLLAAAERRLEDGVLAAAHASCCMVLASAGYPDAARSSDEIAGLDAAGEGSTVFHAGTRTDAAGRLVTSGGRVLNVVAVAQTLAAARARALSSARQVRLDGVQFRTDIGATTR